MQRQSVAVLVDGNYTTDDKGVKTYKPRSDDELKKIENLVKTAIGYNEKRGDTVEVVNMQFADIDAIEVGAHFIEASLGDPQHRQAVAVEQQGPGIDVRQRMVEHVLVAFEKWAARRQGAV